MSLSLSKGMRLVLALSVSLWMAGGCLLGCSNVMGAEVHSAHQATAPEVSADSCHAAQSHPRTPKQLILLPAPRGMQDCPLAMNGTAVTAKHNGGKQPDASRVPVAALPRVENERHTPIIVGFSYLPNRGPTHLRCCVFLI